MTQTLALFMDSYRELHARRLFWFVLALSGLVVAGFGMVGLTPTGMKVLVWEIESPLNSAILTNAIFYKMTFLRLGVGFWLAWLASILALISTAGVFPDFLAGGAIELTLSKPIGRLRLFLTKYAAALLFVVLQVSVFSLGSFLVIGLRGGEWLPGLFLAVPIVTVFFSYLYCVCVLVGIVVRSSIGALLLTLLFWLVVFSVGTVETQVFLGAKVYNERQVASLRAELHRMEAPAPSEGEGKNGIAGAPASGGKNREQRLQGVRDRLAEAEAKAAWWTRWHSMVMQIKAVLPKTTETTELLRRTLVARADLDTFIDAQIDREERVERRREARRRATASEGAETPAVSGDAKQGDAAAEAGGDNAERNHEPDRAGPLSPGVLRAVQEIVDARSVWWVVGTSLAFEAAVLAIAAWIFCRRDF